MTLRLASVRRGTADAVKHYLVWSSRFPALFALHVRAYRVVERLLGARIRAVPGVCTVYLTHGLPLGECFPGLSDFDLVVVFDAPDRLRFYQRMRRRWIALRRFLPANDLTLLSRAEFERWQALGGGGDPLDEVRHWRCLAGTDLRRDAFDTTSEQAECDRIAHGLGHFQNLMHVALKEEPRAQDFALVARRQLHKSFWRSLLSLDPAYLAMPTQDRRIDAWMRHHGAPAPVGDLQAMQRERFQRGPVSRLRFCAGALAFREINRALAAMPRARPALRAPEGSREPDVPIANLREVQERAQALTDSIVQRLAGIVESIVLSSTGSVRGCALYVVLRDELAEPEVARALVDLRAIHRVFDDPWFNEHFPDGLPTVLSRSMFAALLRTSRSSLQYLDRHRRVLHGSDLYAQLLEEDRVRPDDDARDDDLARRRLVYSLHLNQAYLRRHKPALYDFVTLYFPRLALQLETGDAPATAEEAVARYAARHPGRDGAFVQGFMEQHGGKDVDALVKTMSDDAFVEAWPWLRRPIVDAEAVAP